MTRQPGQPPAAGDNKAGKICRPPPPGAFAKTSGADTVNADAAPDFERQKLGVGLVISAPARDDGNLVTAFFQQPHRQVLVDLVATKYSSAR